MNSQYPLLLTLGHLLIGFYFAFYGLWNIYHWRPILETMAEKNIPHALFVLPSGISLQIIAGFMIIFGILVKLAALLLIPFTIVAVFIFHDFWKHHAELRRLNFNIFITNLTISLGALVLLLYYS